jgi:hypothetical protein
MKALQLGLVGFVLLVTACGTTVGTWHGESKLDAKALRADVESSLNASSYAVQPTAEATTSAMKQAEYSRQTWMYFTFADNPSGGSSFDLVGKSNNRWNILTCGIMGMVLRQHAWNDCSEWYEAWSKAHPK